MIRPSVLIFLTSVVFYFGASVEECEDNSFGKTLQDPEDCHGYYLCHNGTKMQQYCAPGMKYEEQIGVCVVGKCPPCNCANIPTPTTIDPSTTPESSSTTESTSTSSEPTESSIDTSTLNSTTTEQPTESTADSSPTEPSTESSTLNSTSTSESTETPNLPTTTEESSSQSTTTTEEPTTTISNTRPPVSCENIPDGSFFSDLVHCRDYYVCRNGQPVLLHCQNGTWFDDINFVCNFRHLVNCPANID